jgi:hypothetical protein
LLEEKSAFDLAARELVPKIDLVTNRFPGGFWEDRGYNRFSGV